MELPDKSSLAWIIGAVVLTLLSGFLLPWRQLLSTIASGDARVAAAVIYGGFTLLGIVLSTALAAFLGWRRDRQDKRRLATALLAEVYAQAQLVAECGSLLNDREATQNGAARFEVELLTPPPAVMFSALASRIILFNSVEVSGISAFYGSLERATRLSRSLPERVGDPSMTEKGPDGVFRYIVPNSAKNSVRRAAAAWRDASRNAVIAIKVLRPFVGEAKVEPGASKIDVLMEELAQIALTKQSPRQSSAM